MLGLIVLAILGVMVWKLWTPALSFAEGFRSLLERPTGSTGLWPFLKGVETVGGEYAGRPTLLILHHKRGRAFIFPGQFDPGRWQRVLRCMHTVVAALENGG